MKEAKLQVNGMSCSGCVRHVRRALEKLAGVETRTVDIGSAEVSFDPDRIRLEDIAAAVTQAGYPAIVHLVGEG